MKKILKYTSGFWIPFVVFGFFIFAGILYQTVSGASAPAIVNYQGKLFDSGTAVDATTTMGFLLYDDLTGGSLLYTASGTVGSTSTLDVVVSDGIFSVNLGGTDTNSLGSLFADNDELYLEVWIEGTAMSPRKRVTASPYAINSSYLMGYGAATASTTAYIPRSDGNGNFTFTGTPQSNAVDGGVVYINPASADADETLFAIGVGGAEKFRVDEDGDGWFSGNLTVTGTATGTFTNLEATDGITLGGEKRTSWPGGGGGDVTADGENDFTATNTFAARTELNGSVGVGTTSSQYPFSVATTSHFSGASTFANTVNFEGSLRSLSQASVLDTGTGNSYGVFVRQDLAYIANGSGGLNIINISDKENPVLVGTVDPSAQDAQSVKVSGNIAYLSVGTDGVKFIDITDPTTPVNLGGTFGIDAVEVDVAGSYLYVAAGADGLKIVDITNVSSPDVIGTFNPVQLVQDVQVVGPYAYLAGTGRMYIVDVSDPTNPTQVSELVMTDSAYKIFVSGNYAYVTMSLDGVAVVDISDPADPQIVGTYDNGVSAQDVWVSDKYLYHLDASKLNVLDISDKTTPTLISTYDANGFTARGLFVRGNYVYLANQSDELEIVDATGLTISHASIGNVTVGNIAVDTNAFVGNQLSVQGGASVGGSGLLVNGDFSMVSPALDNTLTNRLHFSGKTEFKSFGSNALTNIFIFDTDQIYSRTVSSTYLLSIRNAGISAFSVASNGDIAASGTVFASNATIGTPGTPGDLAERVDIAADDTVEAGDVLVVDSDNTDTYRRSSHAYAQGVSGVVSTNPTIVVGNGKTNHTAVMAMVGRVPVKVSSENGAIVRGDLLVAASTTGHAMRYNPKTDSSGRVAAIIGVALESFSASGTGKIMGLVRTGWVNNGVQSLTEIQSELEKLSLAVGALPKDTSVLSVEEDENGNIVSIGEDVNVNGYSLLNVKSIVGTDGLWEIDAEGRLVTKVETREGQKALYALRSGEDQFVFSGTGILQNGTARIDFESYILDIIDGNKPLSVNLTLTSDAQGVYVNTKDATGFDVVELNGGVSEASFDWVVIATRKGLNEEEVPQEEEEEAAEEQNEEPVEEENGDPVVEVVEEEPVEEGEAGVQEPEAPVEEEVVEEAVLEEPVEEVQEEPIVEEVVEPQPEPEPVVEPVVEEPAPAPAPEPEPVGGEGT